MVETVKPEDVIHIEVKFDEKREREIEEYFAYLDTHENKPFKHLYKMRTSNA